MSWFKKQKTTDTITKEQLDRIKKLSDEIHENCDLLDRLKWVSTGPIRALIDPENDRLCIIKLQNRPKIDPVGSEGPYMFWGVAGLWSIKMSWPRTITEQELHTAMDLFETGIANGHIIEELNGDYGPDPVRFTEFTRLSDRRINYTGSN